MNVALLQERPPYIRFEVGTRERRDDHGMPIIEDVENILVTPAGSKDTHVAPADEWIKQKESMARQQPPAYNPQWAAHFRASFNLWREGQAIPENGVPIRTWPVLTPGEIKRCIDAHVLTVEDLAGANEDALRMVGMGAQGMKQKALNWLSDAANSQSAVKLTALEQQNEELRAQVGSLMEQIAALSSQIADGPEKSRRRAKPNIEITEDAIK